MPDYTPKDEEIKVIVSFRSEADRLDFVQMTGLDEGKEGSKTWSSWYPPKEMEDLKSVKYD
jgi:hypothetical protein